MKCTVCGKNFVPSKFANKRQIFCSIRCRSKEYYLKYYSHFSWKEHRFCPICKGRFTPNTVNQINCSIRCRRLKWKRQNREKYNDYQRRWFKAARKKEPEKYRWYVKDRRHKLRQISGNGKSFGKSFSREEWLKIKSSYGNKCAICKTHENIEVPMTIDHIIPLSKGGLHIKGNIQPLCRSCNSGKKDRILPAHRDSSGKLLKNPQVLTKLITSGLTLELA